jgi:hypothetical protein
MLHADARTIAQSAPKYAGDADAEAVLKDCADKIAAYRDHGMHFGYVFLVMGLSE